MPIHNWKRVPAGVFHHFHQRWIGSLCDAFNVGGLPRGYFALAEQSAQGPIPDVLTLQQAEEPPSGNEGAGGVAVLTAPPQTRFVTKAEPEQYALKANRVAIHHPLGDVIAVLEIVSPGNKGSQHALHSFVEKSVDLLRRGVHLLIVDLFPPSSRDPQGIHKEIWDAILEEPFELPPDKPLTLVSYFAGYTKEAYIEPVAVGDSLRAMPLFLRANEHVLAPLEETYQATWSLCPQPLKQLVDSTGP